MPTFVLNDETVVNSYGFRVLNAGGSFDRFDANPVMLNSHENTTEMTLGNWENRVIEAPKLKADTNFDTEMDGAKVVAGQVDRGFIKACSMGLAISFDEDSWGKAPDGVWELLKWELMEASICAVPSNSGALALYDKATRELITEDRFKLSIQQLSANNLQINKNPKMEKIILSTAALSALVGLGVNTADNAADISNAIVLLQNKLTEYQNGETTQKNKVVELQGKLDKQIKLQAEALIDTAIAEGKLTADTREADVNDAIANYELSARMIGKMPAKTSLSNQVNNSDVAPGDVKTMDDFEKLTTEKQLAFKKSNPTAYQALFEK